MHSCLGPLADPTRFNGPLELAGFDAASLKKMLKAILTIRFAEEAVADLVESGDAVCPCHLGIGQEAVAAGVSSVLRNTDRAYGNHRIHYHYLAMGGDLFRMYAEILGREAGASKGMGGSMHLYAPEVGFGGSVPIVGATIPIAVGAGLAAKMHGNGDIGVAYFGDGACEEGVLHESLNMAAIYKLPVLFVCENNLFSSHLDIALRQPSNSVARFAQAHGIAHRTVDGNDVTAVARAAGELVSAARGGKGPGFLEAVTFRWRGHVGPKEDIDVGVQRRPEILAAWKKRDPLQRLCAGMMNADLLTGGEFEKFSADARSAVADAVARARLAGYPPQAALLGLVYAERSRP
jgi:pyruvate dehydrogenase E1 component alpha subunit